MTAPAFHEVHFVNLTRGIMCPDRPWDDPHYCRIQSTHCEQKNWPGVLYGAGPDLLMLAAVGCRVVVHDVSEKDRMTRALWQGLAFTRRACERLWPGVPLTRLEGRGGRPMEQYFDGVIEDLGDAVKAYVRYYGQFRVGDGIVEMVPCPTAAVRMGS